MARREKHNQWVGVTLAVVVAAVTLTVMAHAVQTVTTPNSTNFTYNLAPGAYSAAITPASSQPVLVMGVQNNLGYRGVGKVMMLHVPASFLEWSGLESPAGAAITSGFSATAGTHIVYLDFSHRVDIQVASPDTFRVHNGNTVQMAGKVTLIW
jgi:hypothetical protein